MLWYTLIISNDWLLACLDLTKPARPKAKLVDSDTGLCYLWIDRRWESWFHQSSSPSFVFVIMIARYKQSSYKILQNSGAVCIWFGNSLCDDSAHEMQLRQPSSSFADGKQSAIDLIKKKVMSFMKSEKRCASFELHFFGFWGWKYWSTVCNCFVL